MKRVTATEARRNWFRLLDEIVAGETVVVERDGARIVLRRESVTREAAGSIPAYDDVIAVPGADQADRWSWEWDEDALRPVDAET
ncbi:MAG TPA: hypothetical protein VFH11_02825 [Gemmatimonadota bacterium]|nr:hypothetical protein [Gemmatimonadota bacterium]